MIRRERTEILVLVADVITEIRPGSADALGEHTTFAEDLAFDSLDLVEFVARMEQALRMPVPDEDLAGLTSVGQVVDYVMARGPDP